MTHYFFLKLVITALLPFLWGEQNHDLGKVSVKSTTSKKVIKINKQDETNESVSQFLNQDVSINTNYNSRGESRFDIRGFSQSQILLMFDDMPFYFPYDGITDTGKIPLFLIDEIALIKGGGSLSNGIFGLGGSVNLKTSNPFFKKRSLVFSSQTLFDSIDLGTDFTIKSKKVASNFKAGIGISRGFRLSSAFVPNSVENGGLRENSGKKYFAIFNKTGITLGKKTTAFASVLWQKGYFEVPPEVYDFNPRYWRWTDWQMRFANFKFNFNITKRLKVTSLFYVINFKNTLDSYDDSTYTSQNFPSSFRSTYNDYTIGGFVKTGYLLKKNFLMFFASYNHFIHTSIFKQGTQKKDNFSSNLFTFSGEWHTFAFKHFIIETGFQMNTEIPGEIPENRHVFFDFGPYFNLSRKLFSWMTLQVLFAKRSRFPTLKERFTEALGKRVKNPYLKPEKAYNFEISSRFSLQKLHIWFETSFYYSYVYDLIEIAHLNSGVDQLQNINKAKFYGVETTGFFKPFNFFYLKTGLAMLWYDSTSPLEYKISKKAVISATLKTFKNLKFVFDFYYIGSQDFYNQNTGKFETFSPYFYENLSMHYGFKNLNFIFKIHNITDTSYQTKYGFPARGRTFYLSFLAQF